MTGTGPGFVRLAHMPRFFLHVCNGDGLTQDDTGSEFANAQAARDEAIRSARSIMADEVQGGQLNLDSFIDVEDEDHHRLFRVEFTDALEIRR
jgi:hypothetical protein